MNRFTLAAWLGACAIVVAPVAAVVLMFPPASFSGIILAAQLLICWLLIIGGVAICIAMLEREVRMWADGPINTTAAPTSPTARARGAATPSSALPATPAAAFTLEPAGGALRGDSEGVT